MKIALPFVFVACLARAVTAWGYEPETHEQMSLEAVRRSTLAADPAVLRDLGLKPYADSQQAFRNSRGDSNSIEQLIRFGAQNEDSFDRPANHFYNPLTGQGVSGFTPSPNWAIDGEGDASTTKFSFRAAREYMFSALTDSSESFRLKQFGLMFQSLGQVIHHIQDMAAPQHVRADKHCDALFPCQIPGSLFGLHSPSHFEKWTRDRIDIPSLLGTLPVYATVYGVSDTQTFNGPRKFWHTEPPGPNSPLSGKGIAEFTNRNFLSAGTNFDKPRQPSPPFFALPAFDPARKTEPTVAELCNNTNLNPPCPPSMTALPGARLTFYETVGHDNFLNAPFTNPRASTESIFDEQLRVQGEQPVFALNRFNFDEAYKHLIPRAVAYSAGLTNYFFRGKLDAEPQGPGTLLVKNLSTEGMEGNFGLHYDDAQGTRRPVTITTCRVGTVDVPVDQGKCKGATLVSVNTDPNTRLTIIFQAPQAPSPAPKIAGEYMLVFDGNMGAELKDEANGVRGAVVAKLVTGSISILLDAALIPGIDPDLLDPAHGDFGLVIPKDIAGLPASFKAGGIVDGQYRGMIVNHAFAAQHPASYASVESYMTPLGINGRLGVFRYFPDLAGGTFLIGSAYFIEPFNPGEFENTAWALAWISGANANAGANLGVRLTKVQPFGFQGGSPTFFYAYPELFSVGDDGVVGIAQSKFLLEDPFPTNVRLIVYRPDGSSEAVITASGNEGGGIPARQGSNHYLAVSFRDTLTLSRIELLGVGETIFSDLFATTTLGGASAIGAKVKLFTQAGAAQRGFIVPYQTNDGNNIFSLHARSHLGTEDVFIGNTFNNGWSVSSDAQLDISGIGVPAIAMSGVVGNTSTIFVKVWGGPVFTAPGSEVEGAWTPDSRYFFVLAGASLRVFSATGELLGSSSAVVGELSGLFISGTSIVDDDGAVRGNYKMTTISRASGVRDTPVATVAAAGQPFSISLGTQVVQPPVAHIQWGIDDTRRPYD